MGSYCHRRYVSRLFQNFVKIQPKAKSDNDLGLSCNSHKLMLYNDIVAQSHAGGFHLLPLGVRAFEKLVKLVDEEMQAIGGQKISMTTLCPESLWRQSGRLAAAGAELFSIQDRHKNNYCLSPTHEELVTKLVASMPQISYKYLPIRLYQITRKFRDEMAPRYGLLRGREFEMKDMYTFDASEEKALETYNLVCQAYNNIFDRIGVRYVKVSGATGIIGGNLSHEYHYLSDVGQDSILLCDRCDVHMNKELAAENGNLPSKCQLPATQCELLERNGIEVGHTFYLGTKYSSVFKATYQNQEKIMKEYSMGCFGLGMTRILQASVEILSTETSIRWPHLIAPHQLYIIPKKDGTRADEYLARAEEISDAFTQRSHLQGEVIIDDRMSMTIGRRQVDADRLGYPYIVVVGVKALENPALYEVIDTNKGETSFINYEQLMSLADKIKTI
ncbi:proline--tRNA ligase mitochondrial [Biomphalaria pfeifferi]|uniref:Probable proline--tRNA ligase, mitochondrial n=1 Tax=Biomphalaria pfeifferi TaxID=112525 RepID=A0AAD8ASB6_BIOPF|nr:proline--tRNA ligase mitochondrial [Biomphalaria pfeifferi]